MADASSFSARTIVNVPWGVVTSPALTVVAACASPGAVSIAKTVTARILRTTNPTLSDPVRRCQPGRRSRLAAVRPTST